MAGRRPLPVVPVVQRPAGPRRFKLLTDSKLEPRATAGTIVYRCSGYDYGCARDDYAATGIPHIALTLDPTGDYPFFTHPAPDAEELPA